MIIHGNSLEELKKLEENSVDSVVCDPPYELGFMGKKWDASGIAFNVSLWEEVLRVLKPGGHLLAFSGTRTYHRMVVAIEDAGFEIRDQIQWVYNTGFPKSYNISKAIEAKQTTGKTNSKALKEVEQNGDGKSYQLKGRNNGIMGEERVYDRKEFSPATEEAKKWQGWGTALKPSFEPIVLARKPIDCKSIAENVLKWGTGGLNIDASRIGEEEISTHNAPKGTFAGGEWDRGSEKVYRSHQGRFPANTVTLDAESEIVESKYFNIVPKHLQKKASKKDRNSDFEGNEINLEDKQVVSFQTANGTSGKPSSLSEGRNTTYKNNHPTVKPVELMEWLIKLVTPPNGTVLDPFAGSGSTLVAAKKNNYSYIGIELTEEYIDIIKSRLGEKNDETSI